MIGDINPFGPKLGGHHIAPGFTFESKQVGIAIHQTEWIYLPSGNLLQFAT